jgi:hypothetical protein
MRVVRLMDEPDWRSRLSRIEEVFFATSLRPSQPPLAMRIEQVQDGTEVACI